MTNGQTPATPGPGMGQERAGVLHRIVSRLYRGIGVTCTGKDPRILEDPQAWALWEAGLQGGRALEADYPRVLIAQGGAK